MATKKFINSVDDVVHETLTGLCTAYPRLNYHPTKRVVLHSDWVKKTKNVSIICGGGSGHEPFAAGFVGNGMLNASIAGSIYAAPPPNHILHALRCVTSEGGTLVVIPNYTGDCLNFGIAIEKARQQGLKIADIVIGDDCSIPQSQWGRAGPRGLVGMLFVIKITGALSQLGLSLETILYHAQIISDNIATYGVGLKACSLPAQGPMFTIPDDEIEIGLGVHGEAGYNRIKVMGAKEIVELMLQSISESLSFDFGDKVAVIVNNFGATSQLEQGIIVNEVVTQLKNRQIIPVRIYSGVLMTSLDSAGMHISIFKLIEEHRKLYLHCLDEITEAPCWPGCLYSCPAETIPTFDDDIHEKVPQIGRELGIEESKVLKKCVENLCRAIINNEEKLNNLDRGCGDGDCGSTHRKLADGILTSLEKLQINYPTSLLLELSGIAEECMGGTSGAVYSLMFTKTSSALSNGNLYDNWMELFAKAWRCGMDGVMKYSKAQPGDRTMLDALEPAWKTFNENLGTSFGEAIKAAAEAARKGCEATKQMLPKAGRASYVKNSEFFGNVDAGAYGITIWLSAIAETIWNN